MRTGPSVSFCCVKVHLIQPDSAWEDPRANHDAVLGILDKAVVSRGDVVLLPEMFDTGFSFNIERTRDAGGTLSFLCELADDLGVAVQAGRTVAACHACNGRNVMTVVAPGSRVLCEYTKIHPFQREAERFEAGGEVVTYAWGELTFCPAICYDLRFPELFRIGLKKGAQAFAIGACWPRVRAHHWRALLIARAIENQAFVFGVNRTGKEPNVVYGGGTLAVGPTGEVLGELDDRAGCLSVEVDVAAVLEWRKAFSAWKDAKLLSSAL